MKRIGLISILIGLGVIYANSQDSIVSIPDTNFLNALIDEGVDTNGDSLISYGEAKNVYGLDVYGEFITDLTGIETFVNLNTLSCGQNQLKTLDVSGNTVLKELYCRLNQLNSLNVTGCNALTELNCRDNQLKTLDVSGNTLLKKLICRDNQLKTLDVSGNTILEELYCQSNQLDSLNISNHTELTWLSCDANELTTLDVTNCTALSYLNCFANQLTSLDVNTGLKDLLCSANQLTSLDVSNTGLTSLDCSANQLTSLDVSNTDLTNLVCSANQLTSLDVSNTGLTELDCSANELTSLDVSGNTALTSLICGGNQLTSLDVSKNIKLVRLVCSANQLSSLDVTSCTALTDLDCSTNQLTSLDVTNCIVSLNCSNNKLTILYLSNNQSLESLDCGENQLTTLDISNIKPSFCSPYSPRQGYRLCVTLNGMLTLGEVCIDTTVNPQGVDTTNSPNVYFTTECTPIVYSIDSLFHPEAIEVISSKDGMAYMVPKGTERTLQAIRGACLDSLNVEAYSVVCFSLLEFGNGEYWIYASDVNNRISLPKVFIISGVGIINSTANIFQFYPNPTNDILTIETEYPDYYAIEITSLNGQLILSKELVGTTHQLDLSSFQSGIYFITIRSKDFVTTRKIIKL